MRPLDLAVEYIRLEGDRMMLWYLAVMAPMSLAVLWLIDALTGQRRSLMTPIAAALTVCTVWRWVFQAAMQRRIQMDLRGGQPAATLRQTWGSIIALRSLAFVATTWGSLLVIPAFFGFFMSGFAAPVIIEQDCGAGPALRAIVSWVHKSGGRLFQIGLALAALGFLGAVAATAINGFILEVLPMLLGIDTTQMEVSMRGASWKLCTLYLLFLAGDFYWTVASVFVMYELQSRRLGADLRARLKLREPTA